MPDRRKRSLILDNREELLTFSELGRKIDRCERTVYRWCHEGRAGIKLEHVPRPNGSATSMDAYYRFLNELLGGT